MKRALPYLTATCDGASRLQTANRFQYCGLCDALMLADVGVFLDEPLFG